MNLVKLLRTPDFSIKFLRWLLLNIIIPFHIFKFPFRKLLKPESFKFLDTCRTRLGARLPTKKFVIWEVHALPTS